MDDTSSARKAYLNYEYEDGTCRLTRSYVTDDFHGYMPQDVNFKQGDAGNVTSIRDVGTLGGTGKADNQCFTYDGTRRLTEAWTPKTADCADTTSSCIYGATAGQPQLLTQTTTIVPGSSTPCLQELRLRQNGQNRQPAGRPGAADPGLELRGQTRLHQRTRRRQQARTGSHLPVRRQRRTFHPARDRRRRHRALVSCATNADSKLVS
ncbi:hypothetical protein ACWC9U_31860 [Streptomyces sp. 900116325]